MVIKLTSKFLIRFISPGPHRDYLEITRWEYPKNGRQRKIKISFNAGQSKSNFRFDGNALRICILGGFRRSFCGYKYVSMSGSIKLYWRSDGNMTRRKFFHHNLFRMKKVRKPLLYFVIIVKYGVLCVLMLLPCHQNLCVS